MGNTVVYAIKSPPLMLWQDTDCLLAPAPGEKQLKHISGFLSDTQTLNPTQI